MLALSGRVRSFRQLSTNSISISPALAGLFTIAIVIGGDRLRDEA